MGLGRWGHLSREKNGTYVTNRTDVEQGNLWRVARRYGDQELKSTEAKRSKAKAAREFGRGGRRGRD